MKVLVSYPIRFEIQFIADQPNLHKKYFNEVEETVPEECDVNFQD
jgi:hypothetical protein